MTQRLRIGEADVFGGGDDEPAGDEPRVLAGLDHAREVVHRGIDVRAADRLDEGADDVVVLVALPVVPQQRAIHRTARRGPRVISNAASSCGSSSEPSSSTSSETGSARDAAASSAVSARRASPDASRMSASRASGRGHAARRDRGVGDRAIDQHPEVVIGERLQREQQGSRQQGRDDGEGGVLGGRGDEHDPAVLDAGQQRILLRLREAVDLVEEQNRRLPVEVALSECLLHDLAHIAHPRGHGGELDESPAGGARDRLGECRLAGSGRAPQDHGCRGPCRHVRSAEQHERRARTQQMRLPGDLVERRRPHPHRERSLPLEECGGGHGPRLTAASDPRCGPWRAGLAGISPRRMINPARRDRRAREVPWRRVESSAGRARQRERARVYQARQRIPPGTVTASHARQPHRGHRRRHPDPRGRRRSGRLFHGRSRRPRAEPVVLADDHFDAGTDVLASAERDACRADAHPHTLTRCPDLPPSAVRSPAY